MTLDKEKQATAVKPGLDTGWVCIKMWRPQPAGTRCRVALGAGSGGSAGALPSSLGHASCRAPGVSAGLRLQGVLSNHD